MASRKAFLLRIDPELWSALERWASDELRSVNGEIEGLLERAGRDAGRPRAINPRTSLRRPPGPAGVSHHPSGPAGSRGPGDSPNPPDPESSPEDPDDPPEAPAR